MANTLQQYLHFHIIVFLICFLPFVYSFYNVPSYYGHFSRKYLQYDSIQEGVFTYFQYHFALDADRANTTFFYANTQQNCIQTYNLVTQRIKTLAGTCGTPGDRVGKISIMQFNKPLSVVLYQPNEQARWSQKNMKIVITKNQSCQTSQPGCILSNSQIGTEVSMHNLRAHPSIYMFPENPQPTQRYLYVSDSENHCIKRINLIRQTSEVVAGQCGFSGFMDGPIGFNKLNKPSSLGINKLGVLYFYDEGNQYMRKLHPDGQVYTLLNGACKQFGESRKIKTFSFKNILCYDNWVQGTTKSQISHTVDDSQINICTSHSSQC